MISNRRDRTGPKLVCIDLQPYITTQADRSDIRVYEKEISNRLQVRSLVMELLEVTEGSSFLAAAQHERREAAPGYINVLVRKGIPDSCLRGRFRQEAPG